MFMLLYGKIKTLQKELQVSNGYLEKAHTSNDYFKKISKETVTILILTVYDIHL